MRLPSPKRSWRKPCALLVALHFAAVGASAQGGDPVDPRVAAILARSRTDAAPVSTTGRSEAAKRFWTAAPAPSPGGPAAARTTTFGRPDPALASGTFRGPAAAEARRARTAFFGAADRSTTFASASQRSLFGTAGRDTIYSPAPVVDPTAPAHDGDHYDLGGARDLAARQRGSYSVGYTDYSQDFVQARKIAGRAPASDWYGRRYR